MPKDSSDLPPGKGRAAPFQAVCTDAPASLFGLAPDGVYTDGRCCQRPGELLPRLFTLTLAGGCFLLHFPWGHPRQPLAVILALWSPDFPHARFSRRARDRMGCSWIFIKLFLYNVYSNGLRMASDFTISAVTRLSAFSWAAMLGTNCHSVP